jgi:crotonobetaine/carnitine-CoA ligase
MTELSVPLVTELNTRVYSSCGKPRSGVECRIVDENDLPVVDGTIGEFVLRTELPWSINQGYHGMPVESLAAWRNGWFHTGDLMYRDTDGNYFFVDRKKDAIRRRGENISSIEVEAEILEHPDVAEAAVFGVPSEFGEDEVMAVVSAQPGCEIEARELTEFLVSQLAHFMVPRYVRIMPELPKTPTNKVQKTALRDAGVTADTWDREAAGIKLRKEQLD